jgi:DNA-binding NarL/FixJ family response regulator
MAGPLATDPRRTGGVSKGRGRRGGFAMMGDDPIGELRIGTLTRCEQELLGLLANGWSNRRIADECLLSLHTVRTRVQNVLVKLGVRSKLEAAAFAFEHGLVPTTPPAGCGSPEG